MCICETQRKRESKGKGSEQAKKSCSESSDPHHKHLDESPDNGFSVVELLEPATADPHSTSGHARDSCSPLINTGGGTSSGRNGEK